MLIPPHYYRNPSDVLGLSLDEGETLILPSGKVVPVRDMWDYDPDASVEDLSSQQRARLEAHLEKPSMTEIEELAWKLHKKSRSLHRSFEPTVLNVPRTRKIRESALAVSSDPED